LGKVQMEFWSCSVLFHRLTPPDFTVCRWKEVEERVRVGWL